MTDQATSAPLPALVGGCLCGAIRDTARPTHRKGYYCHCRMCQLAFGNTRAAFLNLRKDEVIWATLPTLYASSKFALRGFCNHCGTPLSFEYPDSARMDLSVGSLDDLAAVSPMSHFAVESRIANWHAEDALPGERLDESQLQSHSPGATNADKAALHIGAVAFIHRFGSSLNGHVHFHVCVVDGVFEEVAGTADGDDTAAPPAVIFHAATLIDETVAAQAQAALRRRILRAFVGRGLLESCGAKDMLAYQHSGFSVDAGVCIAAHGRAGLERLLEVLRPPILCHGAPAQGGKRFGVPLRQTVQRADQ